MSSMGEVPGHAVVACPQAKEVQKRVKHVAAIGLRGDAVVIDVLGIVFHDGLDGQAEPANRLGPIQRPVQIVQQAERDFAVGHFANPIQVGVHAGEQNRAEISQIHKMLCKQVAAVFLDEFLQAGPLFFIANGFEHR